MNIHEYQAKELLRRYGVAVPDGKPAFSVDEAVAGAEALGGSGWVVKAQIHAGGRGAGRFRDGAGDEGGVSLARSLDEVRAHAERMLGQTLVTKQTGPAGREVKRLLIEEACAIERELYLGMLLDRSTSRLTLMASGEGGMSIEEVAAESPEKILRLSIDPATGMKPFHARRVAFGLGLAGDQVKSATKFVLAMYRAYTELDASIVEMNPLVVTEAGDVLALDAKMTFDDNALYRHPELRELRDEDEEQPLEAEAARNELNYVKLHGDIGCMVNGAGLAMATMDIIKTFGGEPANFLDVGGGADEKRVTVAFKLILSDPNVKGILVNIFGGIMRCDVIAQGVIAAARGTGLALPLVVRLAGTNVELGKEILARSGLNIVPADDLGDAAQKIVDAVNASG